MGKNTERIETTDLYEAAFCMASGLKLAGKRLTEDGHLVTVYLEGPNAEKISLDYYNGGSVPADILAEQHKKLKRYVMPNR